MALRTRSGYLGTFDIIRNLVGGPQNVSRELGIIMAVTINADECIGCGICVDECPQNALSVDDVCKVDESLCIDCGTCIDSCPKEAISA